MRRLVSTFALLLAACGGGTTDSECGNGTVDTDEDCDDGNTTAGDGCSAACEDEGEGVCGNGVVDTGEACDDGNTVSGDGCSASCDEDTDAVCGNGEVETGEECDDGNTVQSDDCLNDCTDASCGDGVLQADVEECDDANEDDTDGCVSGCVYATCGDAFIEAGEEECDDGNDVITDACLADCTDASCGDGVLHEAVEECDDENDVETDACLANCELASCGDGEVQDGVEGCDDGNPTDGDGCDTNCAPTGCGNGVVAGAEECDDGNVDNGGGCTSGCVTEFCGDGITNNGEQCDDGNMLDGDCCSAACVPTIFVGFECEPNDTIASANDFALHNLSNIVHAHISPVGDVDVFSFVVVGTGNVLSAESLPGIDGTQCVPGDLGIDTRFRRLDSTGTEIAVHDDGAPAAGWCSGFELPIAAGTYYLSVDESPLMGPTEFDYDLRIAVAPVACGNGLAQLGEVCDGADLGGQDCQTIGGFGPGGTLGCNATCSDFDTSLCTPGVCGDGVLQSATEDCDLPNLGMETCDSLGFESGTLGCVAATCEYDTSACVPFVCGNNAAEPVFPPGVGEACDGIDLRGQTCANFGLVGPGLACLGDCSDFNTSACTVPICGDNVVTTAAGEQCDDGNVAGGDGCSAVCQLEGSTPESEPNEDGSPSLGGMGVVGNDFSIANADGPFSADTLISASFSPAGDEDVFTVTNSSGVAQLVSFETFGPGGLGTCGPGLDTVITLRDAGGMPVVTNDDGGVDFCSLVTFSIPAGMTLYVHATEFGDDTAIALYFLQISFP